ncbi:MAG: transposase [Bacteroidia bacterium]|nr:transposase [Bacteroidia bacterium]
MTEKQKLRFDEINKANTLTAKAWKMKKNFITLYECVDTNYAERYFNRWYKNVIHSNVSAMKKVAKTLKEHKEGIINNVVYNISNAKAEQLIVKIQKLQSIGHGYRNFENNRIALFTGVDLTLLERISSDKSNNKDRKKCFK